jgi:1,2-diacylglycerol 3-beta-galactosyltransferase
VAAGRTTAGLASQQHGRMARTERAAAGAVLAGPAASSSAADVLAPTPLLFLISDTGGGHRSAAVAVQQALERAHPGRFSVALCDPLGGPDAAGLLRFVARLYGPVTRKAPWLWGAAYYLTNFRPAVGLLGGTLLRLADGPVARAVAAQRPAAIVSFHPLTGLAATRASTARASTARASAGEHRVAAGRAARAVPVVTVITDLGAAHAAWWHAAGDLAIVPPGQPSRPSGQPSRPLGQLRLPPGQPGVGRGAGRSEPRIVRAGPPAGQEFWAGPVPAAERAALRRHLGPALGLSEDRLLVVLTGGGEGCGGIGRRAAALLRRFADVEVVAVCGRNDRLRRRLLRRAGRAGGRLIVTGYTSHLPELLRCADLVITKAGPGTITEAACCGAALLVTTQLPGQERGNAELVTGAGAGRRVPGVRGLVTEVGRLREDRAAIAGLRAASARLGRPGDTRDIARIIADLASSGPATGAGPALLASDTNTVAAGRGDVGAAHHLAPAEPAVLAGGGTGSPRG